MSSISGTPANARPTMAKVLLFMRAMQGGNTARWEMQGEDDAGENNCL
jgi:hypothetical protein